jgi:transcriptional regulator with XRE-family HTH domain
MDIYRELGKHIHEIRVNSGMTQEQLSSRSGISSNFLSQIERGRNKCSLETINKISLGLDIPLSRLFDFASPAVGKKNGYMKKVELLLKELNGRDKNLLLEITEDVFKKLKKGSKKQ